MPSSGRSQASYGHRYHIPQQQHGADGFQQPELVPRHVHPHPAALQRPPLPGGAAPVQPQYHQHAQAVDASHLAFNPQASTVPGQLTLMPARQAALAPTPFFGTAPAAAAPAQHPAAAMYAGGWQPANLAAQQQHQQQRRHPQAYPQQQTAFSLTASLVPGGMHAAQQVATGWPTLQPHTGSYELFHPHAARTHPATMHASLHAAAPAGGAAAVQPAVAHTSRRVRRRHPTARRSLLNLFDAAAASDELSDDGSEEASDSDCDMTCSQESATSSSSYVGFAASLSGTPPPHTPSAHESGGPAGGDAAAAPSRPRSPLGLHVGRGAADTPSPAGTPSPSGPDEHMLPLQHLLMSERAQHLSGLEAKAVIYKVAADLAALHDAGVLHRHVTIASVALSRSGNLATARLMGHPYNVETGPGRRHTGGKKAGVDAYLAPELARCPCDCVAYTPAGDMWSLGVVLFVLLSGSHVPFGNRGLCWTSIPNMPRPTESVNKLQRWLEEHLACKFSVINQLKANQDKGKAPLGAGPEMRVIGLDDTATDLLMRLLAADPAARPTARQVLAHPWLAEAACALRPPSRVAPGGGPAPAAIPEEDLAAPAVSPNFEARLRSTASELAHLGFSPATPSEGADALPPGLHRRSSGLSMASSDGYFDCPSAGGPSAATSAYNSSASLADMLGGTLAELPAGRPPLPPQHQQPDSSEGRSYALSDGTALQLLPRQTVAALVASGVLPDPRTSASGATPPYPLAGYTMQPVEWEMEGQRVHLSAIHAVYDINGQMHLCAQATAVVPPMSAGGGAPPASAPKPCAAPAAPHCNPDLGDATSAPILPLLARMLQQQQQQQQQ